MYEDTHITKINITKIAAAVNPMLIHPNTTPAVAKLYPCSLLCRILSFAILPRTIATTATTAHPKTNDEQAKIMLQIAYVFVL